MQRFIVSPNISPNKRRLGFSFAVIDGNSFLDGGPVEISWHSDRESAERAASVHADYFAGITD